MPPPATNQMYQFESAGGSSGGDGSDSRKRRRGGDEDAYLFGDVPDGKRRKFILVDDTQKNSRVRVKVTLDQINMDEIPDSYRKHNSVFPRAYYPVQLQMDENPQMGRYVSTMEDENGDGPPTAGRTTVPCTFSDGDNEIEVPQLSSRKRDRERCVNELGYRMAWGQSRIFSNRPIFLGLALNAYRTKQRDALTSAGHDATSMPEHLEIRPGKRRWLERSRSTPRPAEMPQPEPA